MSQVLRVDQPLNRFVERDARRDEDRRDDGQPGELFDPEAAKEERDTEWNGRQCVPDVVDQVSEKRDRVRENEDQGLDDGHRSEDREAQCNRFDARA